MSKKNARSLGDKGRPSGLDVACKGSLDVKMEKRVSSNSTWYDIIKSHEFMKKIAWKKNQM
jgi:hypothetical protein